MIPRRLLFIILDGLSAKRLQQAIDKKITPNIAAFCSDRVKEYKITGPTATSVFHSELLYGPQEVVHGFTWFDREKKLIRRLDVPEDVMHTENQLRSSCTSPPLLSIEDTVSYSMVFAGGAARQFISCADGEFVPSARWRIGPVLTTLFRGAALLPVELPAALIDTVRTIRRHGSSYEEWNWLFMRLFFSLCGNWLVRSSIITDMRQGSRIILLNCSHYDEASHRRGPDSPEAFRQLKCVDGFFRHVHATAREHGYDIILCSDHGHAAALPFHHVDGHTFAVRVFEACAPGPVDDRFRALVRRMQRLAVRASAFRKWHSLLGSWIGRWMQQSHTDYLKHLKQEYAFPADELAVVTCGPTAHIYVGQRSCEASLEEIEARFPRLVPMLAASRAVGLIVARSKKDGPVVLFQGQRIPLDDLDSLASLAPFRQMGVAFLSGQLQKVLSFKTTGDLVVYGAFAKAGTISFDNEFGTHGGVHPDEFNAFFIPPPGIDLRDGSLNPVELNTILRKRYS